MVQARLARCKGKCNFKLLCVMCCGKTDISGGKCPAPSAYHSAASAVGLLRYMLHNRSVVVLFGQMNGDASCLKHL